MNSHEIKELALLGGLPTMSERISKIRLSDANRIHTMTSKFFRELFKRYQVDYVLLAANYVQFGIFNMKCPLFYEVASEAIKCKFSIPLMWFNNSEMMPTLARIYNEIQPDDWRCDPYEKESMKAFILYAQQVKRTAELETMLKDANSRIEHLELSPYPGPLYCAANNSFNALRGEPREYRSQSI